MGTSLTPVTAFAAVDTQNLLTFVNDTMDDGSQVYYFEEVAVTLPADWQGKVEVQAQDTSVTFYHKASKEKWQENGDIVYENDVPDVYFTSIRVLDGQSTVLDDYVLYVQGEQAQGTAFRDNERAGIFCLKKPEKCSRTKLFWTDTVYTETQMKIKKILIL